VLAGVGLLTIWDEVIAMVCQRRQEMVDDLVCQVHQVIIYDIIIVNDDVMLKPFSVHCHISWCSQSCCL